MEAAFYLSSSCCSQGSRSPHNLARLLTIYDYHQATAYSRLYDGVLELTDCAQSLRVALRRSPDHMICPNLPTSRPRLAPLWNHSNGKLGLHFLDNDLFKPSKSFVRVRPLAYFVKLVNIPNTGCKLDCHPCCTLLILDEC